MVAVGAALVAGCSAGPTPAPPTTAASTTPPTTAPLVLPDDATLTSDLHTVASVSRSCGTSPPGQGCRPTIDLIDSVVQRLRAALAQNADPTRVATVSEYTDSLDLARRALAAYCLGEGDAVSAAKCASAVRLAESSSFLVEVGLAGAS